MASLWCLVSGVGEKRGDTTWATLHVMPLDTHFHNHFILRMHVCPAGVAVANASFRTLAMGELEDTSELKALEALAVQVGKEGKEGKREGGRA